MPVTLTEESQIQNNKERFYRKRSKYVTEVTLKEINEDLKYSLLNLNAIDEYGNERRQITSLRLYYSEYYKHYVFSYDGRLGDYGLSNDIILDKRVDVEQVKNLMIKIKKWLDKNGFIYFNDSFVFDIDI